MIFVLILKVLFVIVCLLALALILRVEAESPHLHLLIGISEVSVGTAKGSTPDALSLLPMGPGAWK